MKAHKKRQKNISEVNKQLAKATITTSEMASSSSQTAEPKVTEAPIRDPRASEVTAHMEDDEDFDIPTAFGAHSAPKGSTGYQFSSGVIPTARTYTWKRMVNPTSRDAPRFKSSKPAELRRFIRLMEDLWKEAGITNDQERKKSIGKYADADCEEEWKALRSSDQSYTWEEFKEELLENYPEAAAAERGTPYKLRKICSETDKIDLGDMIAFYSFRRAFLAEAKKLKSPPAVMSNRELVELFFGCLSVPFASAVLQYLGNKSAASTTTTSKGKGKARSRRPEDKYDLDDVCQAALAVTENSQMFGLVHKEDQRSTLLYTQPVSETKALAEKLQELEGEQAQEKDRLVSLGRTLEAKMGGLENLLKALMKSKPDETQNVCKGNCRTGSGPDHKPSNNPAQKWGAKSYENEKCFWCGLFGHFQADCEDLKTQIRLGNVKMNHEGKLRLKDGSFLPKFPVEVSMKERVEKHYARKPSQFFYGEFEDNDPVPSVAPSVYSQLLGSSNDADKHVIAQLKAELDLRKREDALERKQKLLEQSEKKVEQTSGSTRTAAVLELLGQLSDEDVAAIKSAKSNFC